MKKMRVAIPSVGNGGLNGQRAGHFGHCDVFTCIDTENGEIKAVSTIENQEHVQGGCMVPVNLLASHQVNALIMGPAGYRVVDFIRTGGIMTVLFLVVSISAWSAPAFASEPPEAKQDKGLVMFYRNSAFKGGAIRFNLNHAEGGLGQLLSGTYLYRYLEPGQHTFWSQAISQDSITLDMEAGKIYYVRGDVQMGVFAGRPRFTQVSESEALAELEKLK